MSTPLYYTFTFPPSAGGGDFVMEELGHKRVHQIIVQTTRARAAAAGNLSDDEREAMAAEASIEVQQELSRAALYAFRGELLDGRAKDRVWRNMRSKEMMFVQEAFEIVHDVTKDEKKAFRETVEVSDRPPVLAGGDSDESTRSSR